MSPSKVVGHASWNLISLGNLNPLGIHTTPKLRSKPDCWHQPYKIQSHTIHVWHIYLHEWLIFMVNVSKYTSPMDGMGIIEWYFFDPQKTSEVSVASPVLGWPDDPTLNGNTCFFSRFRKPWHICDFNDFTKNARKKRSIPSFPATIKNGPSQKRNGSSSKHPFLGADC